MSKGVKDTASRYAMVVRGNLQSPQLYKIDLHTLLRKGGDDFLLKPDDIVYFPKSGLSEWNKILNQIMPTLNLIKMPVDTVLDIVM